MSDLPTYLQNLLTPNTSTAYVEKRVGNRLSKIVLPDTSAPIRKMTFSVTDTRAEDLYNVTYFGLLRATGVWHE